MRSKLAQLIFIIVMLLPGRCLWAQAGGTGGGGQGDDPENEWLRLAKEQVRDPSKKDKDGPIDGLPTANAKKNWKEQGASDIWRDYTVNGDQSQSGNSSGGEEENKQRIESTPQTDYQVPMQPVAGALDALHGEGFKEAIENGFKGPVAKLLEGLAQTEPGLYAGATAAENIVNQKISLLFQQQMVMYDELADDPFKRAKFLTNFSNCVRMKGSGDEQGGAGGGSQAKGWVNAVLTCQGDSGETPQDTKVEKIKTEKDEVKSKYNPSNDPKTAKNVTSIDTEKEVSVLGELFNQDAKAASGGGQSGGLDIEKLAKSFEDWFGDYKVIFKPAEKIQGGTTLGARDIKEQKVMPKKNMAEEVKKITNARYKDLATLFKGYCDNLKKAFENGQGKTEAPKFDEVDDDYYWNKISKGGSDDIVKAVRNLSLPERPFQGIVVNALMDMWASRKKLESSGNAGRGLKCEDFEWSTIAPDKVDDDSANTDGTSRHIEILALMYNYAKFVAVDQLLRSFMAAEQYVLERSAGPGSVSETTRDAALTLIYSMARVDDLREAREFNARQMSAFVAGKIFTPRSQSVGALGRALESTYRKNRDKASASNAN